MIFTYFVVAVWKVNVSVRRKAKCINNNSFGNGKCEQRNVQFIPKWLSRAQQKQHQLQIWTNEMEISENSFIHQALCVQYQVSVALQRWKWLTAAIDISCVWRLNTEVNNCWTCCSLSCQYSFVHCPTCFGIHFSLDLNLIWISIELRIRFVFGTWNSIFGSAQC